MFREKQFRLNDHSKLNYLSAMKILKKWWNAIPYSTLNVYWSLQKIRYTLLDRMLLYYFCNITVASFESWEFQGQSAMSYFYRGYFFPYFHFSVLVTTTSLYDRSQKQISRNTILVITDISWNQFRENASLCSIFIYFHLSSGPIISKLNEKE